MTTSYWLKKSRATCVFYHTHSDTGIVINKTCVKNQNNMHNNTLNCSCLWHTCSTINGTYIHELNLVWSVPTETLPSCVHS